jgi:hypothetical protein
MYKKKPKNHWAGVFFLNGFFPTLDAGGEDQGVG